MYFGFVLPVLVSVVGIYLLIKLRAFFIVHPIGTTRELMIAIGDRDSRRAFLLALAGTLGVGNIFGVCAGIIIGGAGSLLWLFVSSFFAMVIKYAETLLVLDSGVRGGGMATVLLSTFHRLGGILAPVYAALTILLSLIMGASMQAAALCDIAASVYDISSYVISALLVILLVPAIAGGAKKIENITEIVIPVTTIIYIIACLTVIFCHFSRIGSVINDILSSALSPSAAVGGGISFIALREGFARGILSNEAGAGTSALAHSRSLGRSPHTAGLFAMCEVVFDSSLLCMLTGIAVLAAVPDYASYRTPMSLVRAAFHTVFGGFSDLVLPLIILAFAYSTIICWYYYGMQTCKGYFGMVKSVFSPIFIIFILFCSSIPQRPLIYATDFLLLVMAVMTLSAIIIRVPRITLLCRCKKAPD